MHEPLECAWGVGEPKWHHLELIEPPFAGKSCPVLMLRCNTDLVVPTL